MRCQATPQASAPFLGRCSMSFLEPPTVDFVLRPLKAFDLMEIPLLSQRLQALFRNQLFAPMVWPRQVETSMSLEPASHGRLSAK